MKKRYAKMKTALISPQSTKPTAAMKDQPDSRDTIFELLTNIAPELESLKDIDVTANLREQIDLDSMDFLNLIEGISTELKIEIPEKDYRQLFSFDDIVAYVESRNGSDG